MFSFSNRYIGILSVIILAENNIAICNFVNKIILSMLWWDEPKYCENYFYKRRSFCLSVEFDYMKTFSHFD